MNNIQQPVLPKVSDLSFEDRVDICCIHIDKNASVKDRAQEYIKQIKNPYAFKCGKVSVNIEFSPGGKTLSEALLSYLISLRKNG